MELKYLFESIIGFIVTSPLIDESIKTVLNYNNSLLFYKIVFLILFWILDVVGYITILDGITRCFLDKNIVETTKDISKYFSK